MKSMEEMVETSLRIMLKEHDGISPVKAVIQRALAPLVIVDMDTFPQIAARTIIELLELYQNNHNGALPPLRGAEIIGTEP